MPAEKFVEKYHSVATLMHQRLSPNPKEAVVQILRFIKAPETEWQIGKTKVRHCIAFPYFNCLTEPCLYPGVPVCILTPPSPPHPHTMLAFLTFAGVFAQLHL